LADLEIDLLRVGALVKARYEVLRRIKIGGMGAVYEVIDRVVSKRRALKVMLPGLVTEAMLVRFRQEASIPGQIDSDNVVDVLDQGVDEERGLPFLVMELLKGEDLGARLQRGRLSPEDAVGHLHRASLALDCAHAADIVHRDLKPENLFVTKHTDGTEGMKVLDFGIAKIVAESSRPQTTLNLGTPLYMSPEQILGKGDIGSSSDIYSLGHVAFTLLTGHAYWEPELDSMASTPFLTCVAQGARERATSRAARWHTQLPSDFDAWFATATATRPAARFDSASELVAELAQAFSLPDPAVIGSRGSGRVSAIAKTLVSTAPSGEAAVQRSEDRAWMSKRSSVGAVSSAARRRREWSRLVEWLVGGTLAAALGLLAFWYLRPIDDSVGRGSDESRDPLVRSEVAGDGEGRSPQVQPTPSRVPTPPSAAVPSVAAFPESSVRLTAPTSSASPPRAARQRAVGASYDPMEKL